MSKGPFTLSDAVNNVETIVVHIATQRWPPLPMNGQFLIHSVVRHRQNLSVNDPFVAVKNAAICPLLHTVCAYLL